ncbi:MAG: hypothetical protein M0P27_08045, partial [Bacteroidales bacterium]|nr:hypothetical protein [Bacteroidales bacterium]
MKSLYYQFDSAGRMVALATTRSNDYANANLNTLLAEGQTLSDCNIPALDITQWVYDETTGLLTQKIYADGNGPSYTYTSSGRLHTRTWARGKTITYTYGDLDQITNVDYSDSTPDVTYTHDRLGRILSVSSSASISTFHYAGLTLDYETQNGYIIKRKQDTLGREIGYELYNPADPINSVKKTIYGYDAFNRLSTITSIIGTETNTFTYTYLQGTDFVNAMSSDSGVQWSRYYESKRDLITAISNSWNAATISAFDYINDPLGRRTKRTDYFNASTITNGFIYNQNSEVINATMNGDEYNYNFDPIGNRQTAVYNALTNIYTANQLNQYTAINGDMSITPAHDLDGNLTWDGIHWSHGWDAENRLISSSNFTSGVLCEYAYDYQ